MATTSSLHEELGALKAELCKGTSPPSEERTGRLERPSSAKADAAAQTSAASTELEEQLRELGKVLSEYTGNTEDLIAEHPLLSVLAAFALGVAVGRLMGRA